MKSNSLKIEWDSQKKKEISLKNNWERWKSKRLNWTKSSVMTQFKRQKIYSLTVLLLKKSSRIKANHRLHLLLPEMDQEALHLHPKGVVQQDLHLLSKSPLSQNLWLKKLSQSNFRKLHKILRNHHLFNSQKWKKINPRSPRVSKNLLQNSFKISLKKWRFRLSKEGPQKKKKAKQIHLRQWGQKLNRKRMIKPGI